MAEDKNLTLHPLNQDGTVNPDINLFPITKDTNVKDSTGEPIAYEFPLESTQETISITKVPASRKTKIDVNFNKLKADIVDLVYPVGSIYISLSDTLENPATKFPYTSWQRITNTFLYASDDDTEASAFTTGTEGGSNDAVVVQHTHRVSPGQQFETDSASVEGSFKIFNPGSGSVISDPTGSFTSSQDSSEYPIINTTGTFPKPRTTVTLSNSHKHSITIPIPGLNMSTVGVSGTNKNMPKYLCVKMWKRIA